MVESTLLSIWRAVSHALPRRYDLSRGDVTRLHVRASQMVLRRVRGGGGGSRCQRVDATALGLRALSVCLSDVSLVCAPQEFLSDSEQGQARLNGVLSHGDRLGAVVSADRVEAVRAKANAAKDDWRNLMDNLKQRETVLQVLLGQDA